MVLQPLGCRHLIIFLSAMLHSVLTVASATFYVKAPFEWAGICGYLRLLSTSSSTCVY